MGQTITEKIFSKAAGKPVKAGDLVFARADRLMVPDVTIAQVFRDYERFEIGPLPNPDLLVLGFDHLGCGHTVKDAETLKLARAYARKYELPHFYDLGRNGIAHQLMVENGFVLPGQFVVGTDSHSTTYGALGAFACGVTAPEAAAILATGETWFVVPGSIRIELTGALPKGVYCKDAALALVNLLGCDKSAAYKAVEVVGSGVQALSIDDRLTICNMIAETGAKSGIIAADAKTREYLRSRTKSAYETAESDPDARYEADWQIRLDQLEPLAAEPPLTENTRPARELSGVKIDHILLGSCTNGRLSDLRVAARMLKGKKIADSVRMIVVPASQRIMREAVREGLVEIFLEAGALVESASCAACIGRHTGVLASGEIAVSTTNRNFIGRMGSRDSFVYLVSPATAAASALEGRITDPRPYLEGE